MSKENSSKSTNNQCAGGQAVQSARKLRDTYAIKANAPFLHREFGFYCLENWYEQGLSRDAELADVFHYDPPGNTNLVGLGWSEAAFHPVFEEKILADRGDHELVQDFAGRHVLVFKGRRSGFMPEYLDCPVKDMKTWVENVKWRLDPASPARYKDIRETMASARAEVAEGKMVTQQVIGGYMYLRSLIGPEKLLYAFYDMPDLIHDCMETWFKLSDYVISQHQQFVTIDEIFFGEDICFNHGPLISPDMMNEFLFPYYQQLITNIKKRQLDKTRHLYIQVDTDGFANSVIQIYHDAIGMDVMSPFEVASGCDVVEIAKQYPFLIMTGGIDKRILARNKEDIDKHLAYVLPAMKRRGGYIPTCDHGVPAEVTLENYLHYRKRCIEYNG